MKKMVDVTKRFDLAKFLLWRRNVRLSSGKKQKGLVASLALLLVVLLILAWIGLARQLHAAPKPALATTPALSQVEPPRRDSSLVYDPRQHVVLLFGGTLLTPEGAQTNETWTWNGSSWQQQHPALSPPPLQGTMVYDAASQQILLFQTQVQSGGSVANEMWTWNGTSWQQLRPPTMPEVLGASLAYDAARGQVILFGGATPATDGQNGQLTNTTWLWNGSTWQAQHPATSPSPRTGAALAYDEAQQQIVLYGGITQTGISSETWTWNGTSWQQVQTLNVPSLRQNALLVYDSATQQMLLFGGINAQGTLPTFSDTWTLQHNGWTKISSSGAPADLYESTTYDATTRTVLVYASLSSPTRSSSSAPSSQTWIWNGTGWKLLH